MKRHPLFRGLNALAQLDRASAFEALRVGDSSSSTCTKHKDNKDENQMKLGLTSTSIKIYDYTQKWKKEYLKQEKN